MSRLASDKIKKLLEVRHNKDVFVTECKTGSSGAGMQSLDAWAMKKSYSKPLIVGYEIKVSRGDFLNDTKWQGYMPYCNELYFVTPYAMVQPNEIPEGVGLMWVSKNGSTVRTKVKAKWRPLLPENINSLFTYVLMTRTKIVHSDFSVLGRKEARKKPSGTEFWTGWLKDKDLSYEFGRRVEGEIKKRLTEEVNNVKNENQRLKYRMDGYDKIVAMCKKLGIDPEDYNAENDFRKKVSGISRRLLNTILHVKDDLKSLEEELEKVK